MCFAFFLLFLKTGYKRKEYEAISLRLSLSLTLSLSLPVLKHVGVSLR